MNSFRGILGVAVAVAVLTVSGCAPEPIFIPPTEATPPAATSAPTATPTPSAPSTPAPEGTKPDIADLVLTAEGLGPLLIGEPIAVVASQLDMARFDSTCVSETTGNASTRGTWLANYPRGANGFRPFALAATDDELSAIAIHTADILTAEGIHVGSAQADVVAAYYGKLSSRLYNKNFSTVYVVKGTSGQLLIEVRSSDAAYWGDLPTDVVHALTVIRLSDKPFAIAGGGSYFWGECFVP